MGPQSFCVSVDLGYLNRMSDAKLSQALVHRETREPLDAKVVREYLAELASRGYEVVPTCDNHNDRGYCQGHPVDPQEPA